MSGSRVERSETVKCGTCSEVTRVGNAGVREARTAETRESILTAAERLYAELGVVAVSNRQVSEAAGQGNNAAVGYHFGTKADLVRAIVVKNAEQVDVIRARLLERTGASTDLRDWLTALVRPSTDYLAVLGNPSWYARFSAQVLTDPALRSIVYEEAMSSPSLQKTLNGMYACLPDLAGDVRASRSDMARTLMVHVTAERERTFADSPGSSAGRWDDVGTDLIDALVGLWQAPVSR